MGSRSTNPFRDKMYGVTSKNVGPFLAFGAEWFKKYQGILIFLLNFPILKIWSRWILRIQNDVDYLDFICQITPSNFMVKVSEYEYKLNARTHPKFSKRIYFAFRYYWWALHYIDEFLSLLKFNPEYSFGFDTLTSYPEENGGTSTGDTVITTWYSGTWSQHHDAESGNYKYDSNTVDLLCRIYCSTSPNFASIQRSIFTFDTSSLLVTDTISSASLWFFENSGNSSSNLGSIDAHIVSSSPTSNNTFVLSDFSKLGSVSFGSKTHQSWTNTNEYQEIALNASGIASINNNGVSRFGARLADDLNNNFVSTFVNYGVTGRSVHFSDYTGTSRDIKLVITYAAAATTHIGKVNNLLYANTKSFINTAIANIKKINNIE